MRNISTAELWSHFTSQEHQVSAPGDPWKTPRWGLRFARRWLDDAMRNHIFFSGTFSSSSSPLVHRHRAAATTSASASTPTLNPSMFTSFLRCCFHGCVLVSCFWNPEAKSPASPVFHLYHLPLGLKWKRKKAFLCRWFQNLHLSWFLYFFIFPTFSISGFSQPATFVSPS